MVGRVRKRRERAADWRLENDDGALRQQSQCSHTSQLCSGVLVHLPTSIDDLLFWGPATGIIEVSKQTAQADPWQRNRIDGSVLR